MKKITNNLKEFNLVACEFTKEILRKPGFRKNALVVALSGDLGAGKTHFVKAVAKEFGIKNTINSPTFVIMKRYEIKDPQVSGAQHLEDRCWAPVKNFIHIDAYRLKNEKEILNLGWKEMIGNPENIIFIEWPENIKKALPKKYFKVKIKHLEGENREIVY